MGPNPRLIQHPSFCYALLTVQHLGIIFVNNQLDAHFFFMYVYFCSLHVSGSHVPIIRRINCIKNLVYVTVYRWPFGVQVWMSVYFYSLHVSGSHVPIIRRVKCIKNLVYVTVYRWQFRVQVWMSVYFFSLHVSVSHVPIIRRINCINTTSGICHTV